MRLALKRLKVKHEFLHSGLITTGILAVATSIGFLFQSLGFTEENIIIVYVLGVLVIAAITRTGGGVFLPPYLACCYLIFSLRFQGFLLRLMRPAIRSLL